MRVLCAIDGSRYSHWALEMLQRLRFDPDSTLLLIHVVDVASFRASKEAGRSLQVAMRKGLELAEKSGRVLLERAKEIAGSHWDVLRTRLIRGYPGETITRTAARQHADLIVLGSRGLTDFRPFLLGSVSRRVLMEARCPVLVVKRRVASVNRIVIGVDGSRQEGRAVEFLLHLPLTKGARMTVATVVPPLPIPARPGSTKAAALSKAVLAALDLEAWRIAERTAQRIRQQGFRTEVTVEHGPVGQKLVQVAQSRKADLAVVGSRGLQGTPPSLMGSVGDSLVKHARCPVLIFTRKR